MAERYIRTSQFPFPLLLWPEFGLHHLLLCYLKFCLNFSLSLWCFLSLVHCGSEFVSTWSKAFRISSLQRPLHLYFLFNPHLAQSSCVPITLVFTQAAQSLSAQEITPLLLLSLLVHLVHLSVNIHTPFQAQLTFYILPLTLRLFGFSFNMVYSLFSPESPLYFFFFFFFCFFRLAWL